MCVKPVLRRMSRTSGEPIVFHGLSLKFVHCHSLSSHTAEKKCQWCTSVAQDLALWLLVLAWFVHSPGACKAGHGSLLATCFLGCVG